VDDDTNLQAALEAIMASRRDELGDPPRPAELLAYRDGTLSDAERLAVEEKIAAFPDAARALLDLAAFPSVAPAPGVRRVTAEEVAADWPALRRRMAAERRASTGGAPVPGPWPSSARAAAALAAGLFLGGVGGLLAGRGPLARPEQPTAGADLVVLSDEGSVTRSVAGRLFADRPLLLVLDTGGVQPLPAYAVRLRREEGEIVWQDDAVAPTAEGALTLLLPPGFLTGDTYLVEIAEPGREEPLVSFELAVAEGIEPSP
jgi:hypothetical protein